MDIRLFPPEEMMEVEIALPLSKSMSNRALVMNALTPGASALSRVAACDDTETIVRLLAQAPEGEKNVGAAGTAMRFLTAYYAVTEGADVVVTGNERMQRRPIAPLVKALRECGADIEYTREEGYPPLRVKGRRLHGGRVKVDATVSSQFISALLIVAPLFDSDLVLDLDGEPASRPYLLMTIEMMRDRGIEVEFVGSEITVKKGQYKIPADADVELDWSAASYWYSIQALAAGWVKLTGLALPSVQGDSTCVSIFEKLGVVTEKEDDGLQLSASPEMYSRIEADLSDNPDIVQTLVVACCMLRIPFRFTGVSTLRVKETDRLDALRIEMLKLSFLVNIEGDDIISWDGMQIPVREIPEIDTYNDHRMAMAFAPAALYASGLVIRNAEVVSKSYPGFWDDMQKAGFVIKDAAESLPTEQQAE